MNTKYFVTVVAPSPEVLLNLAQFGLDLFQQTARATEQNEFVIEGLLTMEEVGKLVEAGYRVIVEEESSKRARAQTEVAEFQEWIQRMEG